MITKVMKKSSKVNKRMSSRKIESRKNEFKMFKIESRTLQDSRIKIKIQDSRFKNQEKA